MHEPTPQPQPPATDINVSRMTTINQSIYQVHRHNDARTDTSPSNGLDLGTPAWHPCTLTPCILSALIYR
jgi:hypothetical protein